MSGQAGALYATFINRRTRKEYTSVPGFTQASYNTDMTKFTDAFQFEVHFDRNQAVDLASHDFVEWFFIIDGVPFQIGVGFLEDFVKETSENGVRLQGNGRDLLGQLIGIPFKTQLQARQLTLITFLPIALAGSYVNEYLNLRNRSNAIVSRGAFPGPMMFTSTAEQMRAAVIGEYADLCMNLVYLDRLGRVTVYGEPAKNDVNVDKTLFSRGDFNVKHAMQRQNFSKVLSEATIIISGEQVLDTNKIQSPQFHNTDPRMSHIFQPFYKTFCSSDLIGLAGQVQVRDRQSALAKSYVRRSNQNLNQMVLMVDLPYHVDENGVKTPWEVGQNWHVVAPEYDVDVDMKLHGIMYEQDAAQLNLHLSLVEVDTLV